MVYVFYQTNYFPPKHRLPSRAAARDTYQLINGEGEERGRHHCPSQMKWSIAALIYKLSGGGGGVAHTTLTSFGAIPSL